jgi:hypothetical protein
MRTELFTTFPKTDLSVVKRIPTDDRQNTYRNTGLKQQGKRLSPCSATSAVPAHAGRCRLNSGSGRPEVPVVAWQATSRLHLSDTWVQWRLRDEL